MAAPHQIAIINLENHEGATPDPGVYPVRFLNIGTESGGIYTLAGVDVAPGALAVPVVPVNAVVSTSSLAVESIGEEPVISYDGGGNVTVSVGSGIYAGTYTQRVTDSAPLTTTMIEAAPTPIVLPAQTGNASVGQPQTGVPGLWVYAGTDPGDQTWEWFEDGVASGDTDLSFTASGELSSPGLVLRETFAGISVDSAATPISASGPLVILQRDNAANLGSASGSTDDMSVDLDVGAAAAGKRIYVFCGGYFDGGAEPVLTIDGATAIPLGDRVGGPTLKGFYLDSDTIGGVVTVTLGGFDANHFQIGFGSWAVTGVGSHLYAANAETSSASAAVTLDVDAGGAVLAVGFSTDAGPHSFTGIDTELFDFDIRTDEFFTGAEQTGMAAETGRTIQVTGNSSNAITVMAVSLFT